MKIDGEQIALASGSVLKEVVTGKQLQDVKGCQEATAACASCLMLPGGPRASCWGDAMLV